HIKKSVKSDFTTINATKEYEINLIEDNVNHLSETNDIQIPNQKLPLSLLPVDETIDSSNSDDQECVEESYLRNNSDSQDEDVITYNFNEKLRQWAISFNISHVAITALLTMLHVLKLPNLPKSSRTLLQTPRETTIAKMGNGHYWHNMDSKRELLTYYLRLIVQLI
ncbi:hypothetical protein PPYR_15718, partial [Photinus pyralis]